MFRFAEPIYLYGLLIVPLIVALHYLTAYVRLRRLNRFGDKDLVRQLMPLHSSLRLEIKFWLRVIAFALLCCTLARPQYGSPVVTTDSRQGIEAVVCVDVSRSMLAEDVTPSRLSRAKMLISSLIDNMQNDKIGLVVFAGNATTMLPITSDYVSAKMFTSNISTDLIDLQGTDIAHAISVAMHNFTSDIETAKAIIIITDGEDHEGGAEEMAAKAKEEGFNIFVLGIGKPEGAPVPEAPGSRDYIIDEETGQKAMSHLNPDMCQRIANAGNGAYIYVDNSRSAQTELDKHIKNLKTSEIEETVYSEHDEQFMGVCAFVFFLLLLELCITDARNPWFDRFQLFKK